MTSASPRVPPINTIMPQLRIIGFGAELGCNPGVGLGVDPGLNVASGLLITVYAVIVVCPPPFGRTVVYRTRVVTGCGVSDCPAGELDCAAEPGTLDTAAGELDWPGELDSPAASVAIEVDPGEFPAVAAGVTTGALLGRTRFEADGAGLSGAAIVPGITGIRITGVV